MDELLPPTAGTIASGAGFGIRAGARMIDIVYGIVIGFFGGVFAGILLVLLEQGGLITPGWQGRTGGVDLAGWGFSLLGTLFYHWLTEGMYGASLGKLLCGLRVVSEATRPIGFAQAFKRNLAFYWDGLFFGLVGYSSMNKSELNQRYGDHWAKTVVIKCSDVPAESKRSWEMFALAFVLGSFVKMISMTAGLIVHVMK
jgi:uncharacterized RDD family membrane protein YckC